MPVGRDRQLDVIIVSWNTAGLLRDCLKSLFKELGSSGIDGRVLVVDNASRDGSPEMVRKEFRGAILIANDQNLGFAKANNQALEQSTGEMVLFLNPDTVVQSGMVQALARHLDENEKVGAVGPRVVNPDQSMQRSASPFPTLGREAWRLFHLDRMIPFSEYPERFFRRGEAQKADVLLGACILARGSVLAEVGRFDERFFVYSEEVDLCMRIWRAGWEIHWLPDAGLVHYGGASTQQVSDEMFLKLYRNKVQLFRKYHGEIYTQAYKAVLHLAASIRILFSRLLRFPGASRVERLRKREAQYQMLLDRLAGL